MIRIDDVLNRWNQSKICDLQDPTGPPHRLGAHPLISDPLKRSKPITEADGSTIERLFKLCQNCYQKTRASMQMQEGKICDLQGPTDPPHRLGAHPLISDPLKRSKPITEADGSTIERLFKLCQSCYKKSRASMQMQEGKICDLQTPTGPPHDLGARPLYSDPLKRSNLITQEDGSTIERLFKLCQNCYNKTRASMKIQVCNRQSSSGPPTFLSSTTSRTKKRKTEEVLPPLVMRWGILEQRLSLPLLSTEEFPSVENFNDSQFPSTSVRSLEDRCYPLIQLKTDHAIHEREGRLILPLLSDEECSFLKKARREEHQVNNSLPILQDPKDPSRSLLLEAEGPIDKINYVQWNGLSQSLTSLQKNQIKDQMRQWLRLNEYQRDLYEQRLSDLFEVSIPIELGPERGRSVFAKKQISQFEVVGPYSGILHKDNQSLHRTIKQKGSVNVLSYLFATRSSQRGVDAFNTGNTISLINTGQLPNLPEWKENNLAAISFGKNLTFCIALKQIEPGEELLFDYGPNYNPYDLVKTEKQMEGNNPIGRRPNQTEKGSH